MGIRAIDVSRWQLDIDWPLVAASGVQAVWIKVGGSDGGRSYKDSRADANMRGAEAAGLPWGTYYFCDTQRPAREQARHGVICGHGGGRLWPAADLEQNTGALDHRALDRWLADFCDETRQLTGRESLWYGGVNTGVGYSDEPPSCPVWIANYGSNVAGTTPPSYRPQLPPAWSTFDVWQFNSATAVPGIPTSVDQNVISDDFWHRMLYAIDEGDDMGLLVKLIMWTRPGSQWAQNVAGFPVGEEAGAFLVYDVAGTCRHIATPEHLNALHYVGVKDIGFVDDWVFQGYQLVD